MIESLFAYLIHRILILLKENKKFFLLKEDEKKELIRSFPNSVQNYLIKTTEDSLISDLTTINQILNGNLPAKNNGLAEMMANYLCTEISDLLDRLPVKFFNLNHSEKTEFLDGKMKLPKSITEIFSMKTYQAISEEMFQFIKKVSPLIPYTVVQLARDTDHKTKQEIRNHFRKSNKFNFPFFQISRQLLGGTRILVDGKVTDQSWVGKIERITSQLNLTR